MNRNAAIGAIVVALIVGLLVGYYGMGQRSGDRIAALEREVADVKSKLGVENQELKARLAETEKRLEQETADRKNAEAALVKVKVWKWATVLDVKGFLTPVTHGAGSIGSDV